MLVVYRRGDPGRPTWWRCWIYLGGNWGGKRRRESRGWCMHEKRREGLAKAGSRPFYSQARAEPPPFLERRYLYFNHGIDLLHVRGLITF